MPSEVLAIKDGSWIPYIPPRLEVPAFIPGVTFPYYIPGSSADSIGSAQTNIGNRETRQNGVELTTWTGTLTGGVIRVTEDAENMLFPGVVDLRNGARLTNCRIVVPSTYTQSDSIRACVRSLLGGAASSGQGLYNCEIHNRAQRPMNGVVGRNLEIHETVVVDCLDGFVDSTAGDAPLNFGLIIHDSVVTDLAFWYTSTVNGIVHGSDTISHNDAWQKSTTLWSEGHNVTLEAYLSPRIGTGTPGAGSETNPYVPESGFNFITPQATQEAARASRVALFPTSDQTRYGVARLIGTANHSQAGLMVNRDGFLLDKGHFSGGGQAAIDMTDVNLPSSMNIRITNSDFSNDMKNPNISRGATKGYVALVRTPKTLVEWSGNEFTDGTPATITSF